MELEVHGIPPIWTLTQFGLGFGLGAGVGACFGL